MENDLTYQALHSDSIRRLDAKFDERISTQMVNWLFADAIHVSINSTEFVKDQHLTKVRQMVSRILNDEPFDYVMGHSIFYGYRFDVNSDVLIPRPETEELVEWAIQILKDMSRPAAVLDIGTGSGCIAITLKKEIPDSRVTGIDVSQSALDVAVRNAMVLNTHVTFEKIDFLNEIVLLEPRKYDLIISNPPYIDVSEKEAMTESTVIHEPHMALFPEHSDPLIFYRKLAAEASGLLKESGKILVEMNEFRSEEILSIFKDANLVEVEVREDLQGKPRMLKAGLLTDS